MNLIFNNKLFFLIAPMAPLVSFIIIGLFGTNFFINYINKKKSHTIAIISILISTLISLKSFLLTYNGNIYNIDIYTWINFNNVKIEIGLLIDNLTSVMMLIVSFISLMVYIYSIEYMKKDKGYKRFFAYLSLFTFSMLILVMSNNLLQLFFGWEFVGLTSYLLIGFWFHKINAIKANIKSFIINRIGDFSLIIGICLILIYTNSLKYNEIFIKIKYLKNIYLPGTNCLLLTFICICIFISVISKSAQFPLHIWLPDSMEGPTPVSALIHAATMVAAGIFMISRISPLFELSNTALSLMIIIGSITTIFMGILSIIQYDIKKIIAYSTLSQLGYMIMALGASAYSIAIFHLITHAFFKALLFLCAGSIIAQTNYTQDIRYINNLKKYMPITWFTFLLSTLSLVGFPFFSGFYSKESIILALSKSNVFGSKIAYYISLFSVLITSIYSFRIYFNLFHNVKKNTKLQNKNFIIKESNFKITIPLILLSIPSVILGFFIISPIILNNFFYRSIIISNKHKGILYLNKNFINPVKMAINSYKTIPFYLMLIGIFIPYYLYILNPKIINIFKKKINFIYLILKKKYFIDEIIDKYVVNIFILISKNFYFFIENKIINKLLINGCIKLIIYLSEYIKKLHSGNINKYIFTMITGLLIFLIYLFPISFK